MGKLINKIKLLWRNINLISQILIDIKNTEANINTLYNNIKEINNWMQYQTEIGCDVNYKSQSIIILMSRINGGQVRLIPTHYNNLKQFEDHVRYIKETCKSYRESYWDVPEYMGDFLRQSEREWIGQSTRKL